MRGLTAAASAVVVLIAAPAAQATQRIAAPQGSGSECTPAEPCSLNEAAGAAKAGDEVIVTPGIYTPGMAISPPPVTNVQIHGEAGAPMPKIVPSFGGVVFYLAQPGDSLSYLEIEDNANGGIGVVCLGGSRVDRVRVRVVGANGAGIYPATDCVIRNSLFLVEGNGGIALRAGSSESTNSTASVRNVTAIATGAGSIGASSQYFQSAPGSFTLEIQNSIVQGGEQDMKPTMGAEGPGNIAVSHSNFDKSAPPEGEAKVIDGGGNQTAAPLFVDAETRDFREAPGSPTIDAGIAGELGPLDLAGSPRVQGSAPDIGAFEFTPPPAPAEGQLDSLAVKPRKFRAGNVAGALTSKKRPPVGATVSYSLSAPATVEFHVEHGGIGRKIGGKCVKQTHGNRSHKKCVIYKPLPGSFSVQGAAGANGFRFSGEVGGKALKPGPYRLVGSAGNSIRRAPFRIVG
jgi:hypothetical protein